MAFELAVLEHGFVFELQHKHELSVSYFFPHPRQQWGGPPGDPAEAAKGEDPLQGQVQVLLVPVSEPRDVLSNLVLDVRCLRLSQWDGFGFGAATHREQLRVFQREANQRGREAVDEHHGGSGGPGQEVEVGTETISKKQSTSVQRDVTEGYLREVEGPVAPATVYVPLRVGNLRLASFAFEERPGGDARPRSRCASA